MAEEFSNELNDAQLERLALLLEELGEAQQAIGKILRHGYESCNPVADTGITNRRELERELGDINAAMTLMFRAKDVSERGVTLREVKKLASIGRWLHHQL
jgi:hypothetical protein